MPKMNSIESIKAFQTLGCKDEIKCAVASRVYLDLEYVVKAENLEQLYDIEFDIIYFRGQRQNSDSEIIIPVSTCTEVDLLQVEDIQRKLGGDSKCVTMAICDPSSTVLYYSTTNDFIEK